MVDKQFCEPFRFLDLPAKLRLNIYELVLLNSAKRVHLKGPTLESGAPNTVTQLTTSLPPTAILATCRLIHQEANPVMQATMQRFLGGDSLLADRLEGPAPRIEVDFAAIDVLQYRSRLLAKILMQYQDLLSDPQSLPTDHEDRRIAGDTYTLEHGSMAETIEALQKFVITAAKALHYQKICIEKAGQSQQSLSTPCHYPQIQIALRLAPQIDDEVILRETIFLPHKLKNLRGHEDVQTCVHVLRPPSSCVEVGELSVPEQMCHTIHLNGKIYIPYDDGQVMSVPRVIAGEIDVYDRWWREG